jgi:hypothetical protein
MRRSRSRFAASFPITASFTNDLDDLVAGYAAVPLGNPLEHLGHRRARGQLFQLAQEVDPWRNGTAGRSPGDQRSLVKLALT